jgi:hypothetical protein
MNELNFKDCFPFPEARQFQEQIVGAVEGCFEDKNKKYVVACLPTAIGKSPIAVTLANHFGDTYFLTSQKSLQKQYINDFANQGMKMVQGRYNYPCNLNTELKCDMGVCHSDPAAFNRMVPKSQRTPNGKMCLDCPYIVARDEALTANMSSMNYTYFFNMVRADELMGDNKDYEPKISHRPLIVLDECIRAGQLVTTDRGLIPIEEIKIGDNVLSYDIKTKEFEFQPVIKTFTNLHKSSSYDHFLKFEMDDGTTLEVTPNHKIYTSNRGYVRADELTENDDIVVQDRV